MNLLFRILKIVVIGIVLLIAFGFFIPSMIALLIGVLIALSINDFFYRKRQHATHLFNSALQSICNREGGIGKVALAFARTGALRGPCYEYARRLQAGEDPVDAAAQSRVPLNLSSAVALRTGRPSERAYGNTTAGSRLSLQGSSMNVYAHAVYLVFTSVVTCIVLAFCSTFITPTLVKITEEFGLRPPVFGMKEGAGMIKMIVAIVAVALLGLMTIISRGSLLGIPMPDWLPRSPRAVEARSSMLYGLADAIDAGMTVDQALQLGARISLKRADQFSLSMANKLIREGSAPADALHQAGWLNSNERNWIRGASARRGSQLLRSIADQRIRDASANMRWILDFVFPGLVILLGVAVLMFAFGFFGFISTLIGGLS